MCPVSHIVERLSRRSPYIRASISDATSRKVDVETRKIKRARIAAAKRGEALLDDVVIHSKGKESSARAS